MIENILERITNIYSDEKKINVVHVIEFRIDDMEYFIRFKNDNNLITPVQVFHYKGIEECLFCKRNSITLQSCDAFKHSKENLEALFHYLTNHPSVRLKLAMSGLTPKTEME